MISRNTFTTGSLWLLLSAYIVVALEVALIYRIKVGQNIVTWFRLFALFAFVMSLVCCFAGIATFFAYRKRGAALAYALLAAMTLAITAELLFGPG